MHILDLKNVHIFVFADGATLLTPNKLHHVVPDAKIIMIMRNPVRRLLSDYNFYYPYEGPDVVLSAEHLHTSVVASIAWWNRCISVLPLQTCLYDHDFSGTGMPSVPHYWKEHDPLGGVARLRMGLYALFIRDWLAVFPKEQFLFLRLEDYKADTEHVLNEQVFPFLSYKPTVLRKRSIRNKTKYGVSVMLPETEQLLTDFYRNYNVELASLLNNSAYIWDT